MIIRVLVVWLDMCIIFATFFCDETRRVGLVARSGVLNVDNLGIEMT